MSFLLHDSFRLLIELHPMEALREASALSRTLLQSDRAGLLRVSGLDQAVFPSSIQGEIEQDLSPGELERSRRLSHPTVRHQFQVSRALLRRVLSAATGLAPAELPIELGAHGKPALVGLAPAQSWQFSLAHAGDSLLLGFHRFPIGVDLEASRPVESLKLARRFFTEAELTWLQSLSSAERVSAFARLWTLKEALVKWQGGQLLPVARRYDMSALRTALIGPADDAWQTVAVRDTDREARVDLACFVSGRVARMKAACGSDPGTLTLGLALGVGPDTTP